MLRKSQASRARRASIRCMWAPDGGIEDVSHSNGGQDASNGLLNDHELGGLQAHQTEASKATGLSAVDHEDADNIASGAPCYFNLITNKSFDPFIA